MGDFGLDATNEEVALQLIQVRYVASANVHIHTSTNNTPGLVASLYAFQVSNRCILHFVVPSRAPRDDDPGAIEAVSGHAGPEARVGLTV